MRNMAVSVVVCLVLCLGANGAAAHCEIPCGIYDDGMRIKLIREHIDTIEKSMAMIRALSAETPVNYNQLVRWIDNKETHASELQHIVAQYFMTQRVKPVDAPGPAQDAYVEQVTVLHRLLISAMKSKQTVEEGHIADMRALVDRFEQLYFHHE